MNLNQQPMREELRSLLLRCDDRAGHHVLWVDSSGEVHLTRLPTGWPPVDLQISGDRVRLRCETFLAGNGYVGSEAAQDEGWLDELLTALVEAWRTGENPNGTIQLDLDHIAKR